VQSARLGGDDPVRWLLQELDSAAARGARYVCELVAFAAGGDEARGTGVLAGRIADEPRGSEGFGYDPIFIPDGEERTVAELGNEWKAQYSHRARAARALAAAVTPGQQPPRARSRGARGGMS
jgi:XTP/dITP diphosphohydrolase